MKAAIKVSMICFVLVPLLVSVAGGAEELALDRLNRLLGEWRGTGDGRWGRTSDERTYGQVFGGKYIRGYGRAVYPKQEKNPSGEIHEVFDMFSFDSARQTIVLREFDNEAFVTTYYLVPENSKPDFLVFVSEHLENVPPGWRARVTFDFKSDDEFHELFDLDVNEGSFERYLTTHFLRVSGPDPE